MCMAMSCHPPHVGDEVVAAKLFQLQSAISSLRATACKLAVSRPLESAQEVTDATDDQNYTNSSSKKSKVEAQA